MLSRDLIELTECIRVCAGELDVRVAYFDGVSYIWTGEEQIIRLIEEAGGIVEVATPSGAVSRKIVWNALTSHPTVEDERVLDEVYRQLKVHTAAADSPVVETL